MNIVEALADANRFAPWFKGDSWRLWQGGGGQREGEDYWRVGYFISHDKGETWLAWHSIASHLQDERDVLREGRVVVVLQLSHRWSLSKGLSSVVNRCRFEMGHCTGLSGRRRRQWPVTTDIGRG